MMILSRQRVKVNENKLSGRNGVHEMDKIGHSFVEIHCVGREKTTDEDNNGTTIEIGARIGEESHLCNSNSNQFHRRLTTTTTCEKFVR